MYRQLIAVALLTCVALGDKIYPRDRETEINGTYWDEKLQAICIKSCNEFCNCTDPDDPDCGCTEPVKCDEATQRKCGETRPDLVNRLCGLEDICIPKECECDYKDKKGERCQERICAVNCTAEQIKCGVKETATGCPKNDECIHRGFTNTGYELCDGFCPMEECEYDHLFCENEPLSNGCKQPADCVLKQKDHNGTFCPFQQCPVNCTEKEHFCEGEFDVYGCKEEPGDECVLKQTSTTGELCRGTCPVHCQNGEILCKGQIDWSDTIYQGCPGQDVCHVKEKDDQGVFCPPDSASHNCPKTCPSHEVLCPGHETVSGCKGPHECKTRSKDYDEEYCPSTSDCPVDCQPGEYNCPTGTGQNGCKLPDSCEKKERGFDGELCPFHCPELCNDDQVLCPGRIDETGCRGASSCRDKTLHKWGEFANSDECPGYCPGQCENHEILCPSQIDPCNGCPTEEVCRHAIPNKKGLLCPGKEVAGKDVKDTALRKGGYLSHSHNCPKLCREHEGEVVCPTYEDENGCKPEAECTMRTTGRDGKWCPYHSVCPKQCEKGYLLCEYDVVDSNGCKIAPLCVPKGKTNNDTYCPGQCLPVCLGKENSNVETDRYTYLPSFVSWEHLGLGGNVTAWEPAGNDENGCALPSVCQEGLVQVNATVGEDK